jgi:DnaJ-class molecular chaperone
MATAYQDYYKILGVPRDASQKDIKSAYRKLARRHHPDVNPGDAGAEARFKEINEANEVLSDPEKRRTYDEIGPRWREQQAWESAGRRRPDPFAAQRGEGPRGAYRTMSPEDMEDLFGGQDPFSDFFHEMFGGGSMFGGRARTRSTRARRGEDVEGEVEISLEEAYSGTTRTVEMSGGEGTRRIEVRIPAGIHDGARVRAAGQGARGAGAPGDLYVRVHVRPHPLFRREGDDLYVRVTAPLDVALLGGEVEVPTPKGTRVSVRVPPGTQNGARLRLRGLGMPHLRGEGTGDLYAEVDVRLPTELTPELRALAEALRGRRETAHAV